MDYKKIIPSQRIRLKILKLADIIPDKLMIKLQYRIATGRRLDLKNPVRFTEKLQWYKLYYRTPLMTQCADKYRVREYIKSKGYEDILVPLYGVYDDANEIKFADLPSKFVLKTTNGSHTNILCENKQKLDVDETILLLNNWVKKRSAKLGREWAYYDIEPKIICEKYLEKDENNDLIDYKFFCFNGKAYCLYVIAERFSDTGIKLGIYDMDFKILPYNREDIQPLTRHMIRPKNFDKMVQIAEDLAKDFTHVRVDFYNVNGKITFGELTFYDGSGYKGFIPDEFDFELGNKFILSKSET